MHHGYRQSCWRHRLHGEVEHDDRIFAAREQEGRPIKLGDPFANDMDRLGLQLKELARVRE